MFEGETGVEITPPVPLEAEQTKNIMEAFNKLFYNLGKVTSESVDYRAPEGKEPMNRPIWERAVRAKILNELHTQTTKTNIKLVDRFESPSADEIHEAAYEIRKRREDAVEQGHAVDKAVSDFLTQGTVKVTSNLGEQSSRYTVIEPITNNVEKEEEPPIVIVPGFSNDIECVGPLAVELALRGRKVIVIGYPTSSLGTITDVFAESVEQNGYQPFSEYFQNAIQGLTGNTGIGSFELWGWSTGGPIVSRVSETLGDSIDRLVLLNPVSSVAQSMISFGGGMKNEITQLGKLASYPFVWGAPKGVEPVSEIEKAKAQAVKALATTALTKDAELVSRAKVRDGGTIVVVSATNDMLTKSNIRFPDQNALYTENNKAQLIQVSGSHVSAIVEPDKILNALGVPRIEKFV